MLQLPYHLTVLPLPWGFFFHAEVIWPGKGHLQSIIFCVMFDSMLLDLYTSWVGHFKMTKNKLVAWKEGGSAGAFLYFLDTRKLCGTFFLISRSPSCPCSRSIFGTIYILPKSSFNLTNPFFYRIIVHLFIFLHSMQSSAWWNMLRLQEPSALLLRHLLI